MSCPWNPALWLPKLGYPGDEIGFYNFLRHTQDCLASTNAKVRIPETVNCSCYFNFGITPESPTWFTTRRLNPLLLWVREPVAFSIDVWPPAAETKHLTHLGAPSSTGPLVRLLLCSRSVENYDKQKAAAGTSESQLESWRDPGQRGVV
jgi:hypothetical protein